MLKGMNKESDKYIGKLGNKYERGLGQDNFTERNAWDIIIYGSKRGFEIKDITYFYFLNFYFKLFS